MKAAAVALLAWGCSSLPSAPTPITNDGTPSFVRVTTGGATSFSVGGSGVNSRSNDIDGAKGGTLNFGNFTLVVPPGAFVGKATLTITVPDPSLMRCQLSISPPEANRFAIPVQLVSNCSSAVSVDPWNLQTLWFDEINRSWVVVSGSVLSPSSSSITTPLLHFSLYGVVDGKAGW